MENNTKYASISEVLSRVTMLTRGFDKTVNESDVMEWCMIVENHYIPNVDNMYIYTGIPIKVTNGRAKVPCNRYRIADVTECAHGGRLHFNDLGAYITFHPKLKLDYVYMDWWGTPIDLETGKPMVQIDHVEACAWFCMYNLFLADAGTGKITADFWHNTLEGNFNKECDAARSSNVRFKTRGELNDEQRITFEMFPQAAKLWLLRDEGQHYHGEEKKITPKPVTPTITGTVTSGMIDYGSLTIGDSIHKDGVVNDATWTGLIPTGRILQYILVENTSTNAAQLSMGTTLGGNDIFASATINEKVGSVNGLTTITVGQAFSMQGATNVFLNHLGSGDDWNSATLNFIFLFGN